MTNRRAFRRLKKSEKSPPAGPAQTVDGQGNLGQQMTASPGAIQAGRDVTVHNSTPEPAPQRNLVAALTRHIAEGRKLLTEGNSSNADLYETDYDRWKQSVLNTLEGNEDWVTQFDLAPISEPTGLDYREFGMAMGVHDLWPEVWKRTQVLTEIQDELRYS